MDSVVGGNSQVPAKGRYRHDRNSRSAGIKRQVDVVSERCPCCPFLRDELGITSAKCRGCGVAQCGACTVPHRRERRSRSCQSHIGEIAGKSVVTLGPPQARKQHPVLQAWIEHPGPAMQLLPENRTGHAGVAIAPRGRDSEADGRARSIRADVRQSRENGTYPRIRAAIPCGGHRRWGELDMGASGAFFRQSVSLTGSRRHRQRHCASAPTATPGKAACDHMRSEQSVGRANLGRIRQRASILGSRSARIRSRSSRSNRRHQPEGVGSVRRDHDRRDGVCDPGQFEVRLRTKRRPSPAPGFADEARAVTSNGQKARPRRKPALHAPSANGCEQPGLQMMGWIEHDPGHPRNRASPARSRARRSRSPQPNVRAPLGRSPHPTRAARSCPPGPPDCLCRARGGQAAVKIRRCSMRSRAIHPSERALGNPKMMRLDVRSKVIRRRAGNSASI